MTPGGAVPGSPAAGEPSGGRVAHRHPGHSGLALICLAAAGFAATVDLPGIDGLSLGAGTMPRVYAVLLALCGAALALRGAFEAGARSRPVALRPAGFVVAALLVFALTLRGARLSIGEHSLHIWPAP